MHQSYFRKKYSIIIFLILQNPNYIIWSQRKSWQNCPIECSEERSQRNFIWHVPKNERNDVQMVGLKSFFLSGNVLLLTQLFSFKNEKKEITESEAKHCRIKNSLGLFGLFSKTSKLVLAKRKFLIFFMTTQMIFMTRMPTLERWVTELLTVCWKKIIILF